MFVPKNEMGVIVCFAQQAKDLGIDIIDIGAAFPDLTIMYQGVTYRVEAEYKSSNFVSHGHDPLGCDAILCWLDDMEVAPVPTICLSDTEWHKRQWHIMTPKDKEIQRLHAEIRRLRSVMTDIDDVRGIALDAKLGQKQMRQSELLRIIKKEFNGQPADALNKTTLGERLGATRQTIGRDIEELQQAQRLSVNGHIQVM